MYNKSKHILFVANVSDTKQLPERMTYCRSKYTNAASSGREVVGWSAVAKNPLLVIA